MVQLRRLFRSFSASSGGARLSSGKPEENKNSEAKHSTQFSDDYAESENRTDLQTASRLLRVRTKGMNGLVAVIAIFLPLDASLRLLARDNKPVQMCQGQLRH